MIIKFYDFTNRLVSWDYNKTDTIYLKQPKTYVLF